MQTLMCVEDLGLRETGSVTPIVRHCECMSYKDYTDTRLWRCHTCSRGTHAISHDSWDYPIRGSSKNLTAINSIRATTRGSQICFQTIVLWGCSFAKGYDMTLRMRSMHTTFCGQTMSVLRVRVCSTSTAVTSARDNLHTIRKRRYQVRVSVWAGIVGDIVLDPYLPPHCSTISWFCWNFSTGPLQDVPLSVCGLVVSVADYKHRSPGFDSWALLRIFLRELGLERGPLSLVIG
jgi:hypothetical protein